MNYRESLSVTWLICWRTWLIFLPFTIAAAVLLQTRQGLYNQLVWSLPGWLCNSVAELLIFYIWIVPAPLGKRYSGFSLVPDRTIPAAA
jgi:hypothetical protein